MTHFHVLLHIIKHLELTLWPVDRYVKLWVMYAPGILETFSPPPPRVSDRDMHHGMCVTDVPWCMPGSLSSGFIWNRWRGKHSRHSRRMHNPQFYVFGKRPIERWVHVFIFSFHLHMPMFAAFLTHYIVYLAKRTGVSKSGRNYIRHCLSVANLFHILIQIYYLDP